MVVTDHKPLHKLYSSSCSEPPTRIHRWSLKLQEFDFNPLFTKLSKNRFLEGIVRFFSYLEWSKIYETES